MAEKVRDLGGNTFGYFTRNPRGGRAKPLIASDVENFQKIVEEDGFGQVVAHAPYTLNLCSSNKEILQFSLDVMQEDIKRMERIPGNYYNFHPGSRVEADLEEGIKRIAHGLNCILTDGQQTVVLLETMAGKGSEVGSRFEELRGIIDKVTLNHRLGVCFNTCHVWDAGYDIVNDLDGVLEEFDRVIGIDRLRAVYLNDSLNGCGAHRDRHARLGEGRIGEEAMRRVVTHPLLKDKPFILETPNEEDGFRKEIEMIHRWAR